MPKIAPPETHANTNSDVVRALTGLSFHRDYVTRTARSYPAATMSSCSPVFDANSLFVAAL